MVKTEQNFSPKQGESIITAEIVSNILVWDSIYSQKVHLYHSKKSLANFTSRNRKFWGLYVLRLMEESEPRNPQIFFVWERIKKKRRRIKWKMITSLPKCTKTREKYKYYLLESSQKRKGRIVGRSPRRYWPRGIWSSIGNAGECSVQ